MIKTAMIYFLFDKCLDILENNLGDKFIIPFADLVPGHYKSITIDTGNTIHVLYNAEVTCVGSQREGIDGICIEFTLYGKYVSISKEDGYIHNQSAHRSDDADTIQGIQYVVPIKNIKSFDR